MSLNKENVSPEISENKIAVCEKTQGLRSGKFSDLNSACSTVLVPVKIFQFQDMHYENRFLGTFQGHSKRPKVLDQGRVYDLSHQQAQEMENNNTESVNQMKSAAIRNYFAKNFNSQRQGQGQQSTKLCYFCSQP